MASMPSRLILSVLVGLAVAAGAVGAAGGSAEAGSSSATAAPVRLPALHVGDQGKYVTDGDELRFRFDQVDWVGQDGTVRPTLVLTQESDESGRSRYWLLGTQVLASQLHVGGGGSGSWTSLGDDVVQVMGMAFYDVQETRFAPAAQPPLCGLVVAVSSASVEAAGCGRFERVGDSSAFAQGDGDQLVLDEGLPVPAQVRVAGVAWDLAAFQRGDRPPADRTGPAFPVQFEEGATPVESGLEHEFPLSTALLFARDLPGPSPLRAFLADHPDAYLASAAFRETVEPGRRSLAWTLTASDGVEHLAVEVVQWAAQAHDPPVTLSHGTGLVLPAVPAPTISEVPAPSRPYPRPGDWQPRFATLGSLAARWEAAVPSGALLDGINAYGFDVLCAPGDCATGVTETWIGIDRIRSHQVQPELPACPTLACDYARWVWVVERLAVRDDGQTSSQLHSDWILYDEASGPIGPLVVGDERQEEQPLPDSVLAASLWALPSSRAAAGAGLLGLVSGLLCYLWPQLKAAAVGLWQRRGEPEHPTRERLALLVASQPGIHFHELRRQSGLAAGTLRHHLTVMEGLGTLVAHASAGYKVYFPPRGTARGMAAAAPALKAPAARRILERVVTAGAAGGLTMGEAAVVAGLTPSTATYHVRRLSEAGLVTRQRRGRTIALLPTPLAGGALTGARAAAPA